MPECAHENKRIVWTTVGSSGEPLEAGRQLRFQCITCGRLLTQQLAHRLAKPDTPDVDLVALNRWNEQQQQYWKNRTAAYQAEREAKREAEHEEWLELHSEYLQTEKWRGKREAVLRRSGGICEGCRQARAVQVHHLTYDHWRDEFCWELVAVCLDCHERAHGRKLDE